MMQGQQLHVTDGDRLRARRWFIEADKITTSAAYEARRTRLSLALSVEVALALSDHPPSRILDVGCGDGAALERVAAHLPDAELVGLDPAADAIDRARRRLADHSSFGLHVTGIEDVVARAPDLGRFDLVLSHMTLAMTDNAAEALKQMVDHLAPGGHCYVIDLLRPPDWDGHHVARWFGATGDDERAYVRDQLLVSLTTEEFARLADHIAGTTSAHARVGFGGLGGHPLSSPGALALWRKAPQIATLLASGGARSEGDRNYIGHLVLTQAREPS